jgi:hypothetical protein
MADFGDFDSIHDALKAAVRALGGAKKVGPRLRPAFTGDAAGWLLNCLNPEHLQELHIDQALLILRWANDAGYHEAKHYADKLTGYAPSVPLALEAQLLAALKDAKAAQQVAEEKTRDLQELANNPKLLALADALHLKVRE